jgi:ketosteroid isomerase-like protein
MGLDEQLQRVADELEIRNLIHRLAQLADDGQLEEYIQLFTEDAVWEGAGYPARRGHADILTGARERRASGIAGPGTHTRHVVANSVIQLQGDAARATSVFHFYGNTDATPELRILGVYNDELRRTPKGWKLARRSIGRSSAGS